MLKPTLSLRFVLGATALVAVVLGWQIDRSRLARALHQKTVLCDRLTEHLDRCGPTINRLQSLLREARGERARVESSVRPLDPFAGPAEMAAPPADP